MMRLVFLRSCWLLVCLSVLGSVGPARGQLFQADPDKKFDDWDKTVKGAKEYEGLFKLYLKEDRLYAEINNFQLDKPFLCPIAIARGLGFGGHTLNFGEQWVVVFKRVGDNVHLVRRNVRFQAKKSPAAAHAVETTYTDSVLLSIRIVSVNHARNSILINLNNIFMTDFAQLGTPQSDYQRLGHFDASRSIWHKIKAFPRNIELEVAAVYSGGRADSSVIDERGTTVVIHYGLCQLPEGYQPRLADDRVGYFLSVVKDFSTDQRDTAYLRYVNRWRLERAEPVNPKYPDKLSAPKKKIVFWIEKSVPEEYRAYVREGILEWNKAFEKIGFRDAIEVRQQENEDFDPEDINYNTFRWITSDHGYAMGPSRSNPLTGEILDADIVFDASMVRFYRTDARVFGTAAEADPISPIRSLRQGTGLFEPALLPFRDDKQPAARGWNEKRDPKAATAAQLTAVQRGLCQCGPCMRRELHLAALALAQRGPVGPDGKPMPAAVEELIGQAIKEVTMHEVGHTLGLRHNFKASTMLDNKDLHNTAVTRKQGLVGSVMDYAPVNIAPKGHKQGDYFTTTIGPYDYWAIEYAYRPLEGGTEGELDKLQEIAAKGALPGHHYGTDEDLYTSSDPLLNQWDLGSDPMKFAIDRIDLATELLKNLAEKSTDKGEGYQQTRVAFAGLLQQFGDGAHLIANFIGGVHINRDHRGDPSGRDPQVPVPAAKQREALKYLQEHILTDKTFQLSPQLLRRLAADRWLHWGNERSVYGSVEFPVHERILDIQRVVLEHLFDPSVLGRIQNNSLKVDGGEKPLTIAEVFRSLTDGIWNELADGKGERSLSSSIIRRNLQREHLTDLAGLVVGSQSAPPDARSLARMHLREIARRIEAVLNNKQMTLDDTTRAHLEECQERIAKVMGASVRIVEP
jgi:hypothetical protein